MKLAKEDRRTLILDACVGRAAGGEKASHPTSVVCRQVLLTVLEVCHRAGFTPELIKEWDDHQSNFAKSWRVEMLSRRKITRVTPAALDVDLEKLIRDDGVRSIVEKDWHLVEAARAADKTIVSVERRAYLHLLGLDPDVQELGELQWVNPELEGFDAADWLEHGAKQLPEYSLCPSLWQEDST